MLKLRSFLRRLFQNRKFFGFLGLLALSAIIWWVGPLLGFGDSRPLESATTRWIVIGVLFTLFAINLALSGWKRKRANAALLDDMERGPSASDKEAATLDNRFSEAVKVLQTSKGKQSLFKGGQYLYELPWYIFIGAPGSGKTTALLNAGLTFPLAEKLGQSSIKGTGGTRNCDWWFTDEAVLIDTAGRYTIQESDEKVDASAWDTFLTLLKKNRPRRPLNGVLLTINLQDLLQQSPPERQEHAAKLRARIQELHAKLGIRPPVYVLLTKTDLLAGFNETFASFGKEERNQVWGFSFPYDPASGNDPLQDFPSEFAALEKRIREQLLSRMETESDVLKRTAIFAFPQQLNGIKGLLGGFLEQVFSGGGALEERPVLRGVYFTSGTQEGTAIDRVLGTLSRTFGVDRRMPPPAQGRGKSFFLNRLLKDVVFAEQGLVGLNRALELRQKKLRLAGLFGIALLSALLLGGWSISYFNNKSYVAEVDARVPEIKQMVEAIPPSANGDVTPLADVLGTVSAAAIPANFPLDDVPMSYGFGLFQGDKLNAAADLSYRRLLDKAFMPRVATRLEERLRAVDESNLELAYEALKAYLMLYTPDHFDPEALKAWITLDWEVNLQRALTVEQRQSLSKDLETMLAQGAPQPSVPKDDDLVKSVREMLNAYPLEFRVFSRLKRLNLGSDLAEFSVASAGGPNTAQVFTRTSGEPLTKGIPGIYSREGYHKVFKDSINKVVKQLASEEEWVLGRKSSGVGDAKALALGADTEMTTRVRRLFLEEYIKVWDTYLNDVTLVKLGGLDRSLQVARLLASPGSPLERYLRAVARETTLVPTAAEGDGNPDTTTVGGRLAFELSEAKDELSSLSGLAGQPAPTGGADQGPIEQMVDDHFANIHAMVEGKPAPVEDVTKMFNEVYVQLAAVDAAKKSKAPPPPGGGGAAIKAAAGLQPEPIKSMLESLVDAGASQSRVAEREGLSSELKPISDFCRRAIAGRYPFSRGSRADVLPDDFSQMFGVGGMMDDFFQRRLSALVDTGNATWRFKPLEDGSKSSGGASLVEFQRAARIRDVFFRSGGRTPAFRVDIRALELDGMSEMTIDIDGQAMRFVPGNTSAFTVNWPPSKLASQVKVVTVPSSTPMVFDGTWALFRMFDRFEVQTTGQSERFQVVMNIEGKRARIEVIASSALNPFRLREIQQFRCPGSL